MKKSKIKDTAAQLLAANVGLEVVHMTSDGLGYSRKSIAEANQNSIDASKKIISFGRDILTAPVTEDTTDTEDSEPSITDLSVPKLTAALEKVTDAQELEKILESETAKGEDARSTAIEAIEKRIQVVADAAKA